MKSPNDQYLIAQVVSNIDSLDYNIALYDYKDSYRVTVSTKLGMFSQAYIEQMLKLSQVHKFHFYISASFQERGLYMIIY